MNHNYNLPYPQRQIRQGDGNQYFGSENRRNLRSYVDQALSSTSGSTTNFRNSFQQQLDAGNLQTFFRQWFHANPQAGMSAPTNNANNNTAPNNMDSSVFENMHLKMELLKQYNSLGFRNQLELRQKLPVMRQQNAIVQSLQEHQVILIVGDKGSGKSSQVPQLVLDDYILNCRGSNCRVICAVLTKMSAITLAERVAGERNETIGKTVGFQVRRESCLPRSNGSILYCTNGMLLKELRRDPLIEGITVCILDNIHERNAETNQIMASLKNLLPRRPDIKIILLSNGVMEDAFCEYFSDYHVLFIQDPSVVDLTLDDQSEEDSSADDDVLLDLTYGQEKTIKQKDYNKARASIRKHRLLDPASLSEQQKNMILRHKQTVEIFERANPSKVKNKPNSTTHNGANTEPSYGLSNAEALNNDCIPTTSMAGVTIKRTISMDEQFIFAKRSRYDDSLDDDTELQIAVIDLSDEKGRMSSDKWLLIEKKLMSNMTSEKWSKDEISFDSVNWYRGIKVISCSNKLSLDFLKSGIAEYVHKRPNEKLKVVPRSTIPSYTYATVWIPPPILPIEKILQLIKKQNDGLNTDNWKITPSARNANHGKEFRLVIDGSSIQHIRDVKGRIKFGLGSIYIRLHGY